MRYIFVLLFVAISIFGQNNFYIKKEITARPSKTESGMLTYNIYQSDDILYSVTKEIDYDLPHHGAAVFADGSLLLCNSVEKDVELFSNSGEFVKLIDLGEFSADYEIPLFYAVDGNEAFIVLPQHQQKLNKNIILNSKGEILSQFDSPFQQINGVSYSTKSGMAAISKISWQGVKPKKEIVFLDKSGDLIDIAPGAFFKGIFTEAGFWALDKKNFKLIQPNGHILVDEQFSGDKIFLDLISNGDEVYVVSSGTPVFKDGEYISSTLEIMLFNGEEKSASVIINENLAFDRLELVALEPVVVDKRGKKIPVSL